MTTAARLTSSFSEVSGWSSLEKVATAETARVSARAYGLDSRTACCALTTRAAAMSSIARVIFFVELTARMRCRYSRICAPIRFRLPGSAARGAVGLAGAGCGCAAHPARRVSASA